MFKRLFAKKHIFNEGWPLGKCIFCGKNTGLDKWQLVSTPFDMAYCDKGAPMGILERFGESVNCLQK